jgi:hypothetical protein
MQLFSITLVGNSICLLLASLNRFPYADTNASAFALGNILVAVSARNELFLRGIFWLCVTLFQKVCLFIGSFLTDIDNLTVDTPLVPHCPHCVSPTPWWYSQWRSYIVPPLASLRGVSLLPESALDACRPTRNECDRHILYHNLNPLRSPLRSAQAPQCV